MPNLGRKKRAHWPLLCARVAQSVCILRLRHPLLRQLLYTCSDVASHVHSGDWNPISTVWWRFTCRCIHCSLVKRYVATTQSE
jgi:hypothetical protein